MRALLLGLAKSIYYITVEFKIMVRSIKWHTAKAESVLCDPLQSRSMAAWNLFVYEDKESKKLLMLMSSMYLSSYRSWLRINHSACTIQPFEIYLFTHLFIYVKIAMGQWLIQLISGNRFGSEPQPAHFVIFLGHTLLIQGCLSQLRCVSGYIMCSDGQEIFEIAEGRGWVYILSQSLSDPRSMICYLQTLQEMSKVVQGKGSGVDLS